MCRNHRHTASLAGRLFFSVALGLSCFATSGCLDTLVRAAIDPQGAADAYVDSVGSSLTGGTVSSITAADEAVASIENVMRENPDALNTEGLTQLRDSLRTTSGGLKDRPLKVDRQQYDDFERRRPTNSQYVRLYQVRNKITNEVIESGYLDSSRLFSIDIQSPLARQRHNSVASLAPVVAMTEELPLLNYGEEGGFESTIRSAKETLRNIGVKKFDNTQTASDSLNDQGSKDQGWVSQGSF